MPFALRKLSLLIAFIAANATAEVNLMPQARIQYYRERIPFIEDAFISEVLSSQNTYWYDGTSIIPGYQDSMGDPVGFRPNTLRPEMINLAVPGGWQRIFESRGFFKFPFKSGGADLSSNMIKVNFWAPPREKGQILPVAYWKTNFTRVRWLFPVGTLMGEVLLISFPNNEQVVFEIRVREREITGWKNTVYRPFPTAIDLYSQIRRLRPDAMFHEVLSKVLKSLVNDATLMPRTLESTAFKGTFNRLEGHLDYLPPFNDPALTQQLLTSTVFQKANNLPWKSNASQLTYAASTTELHSVVPLNYDAGMLAVDDVSCRRCHKDGGRQIGEFYPDMVLYGEMWGEDETFSWHPFETSAFLKPDGEVNNFNYDNRRIRSDFVQTGLVQPYQTGIHPERLYKEIPRDWKYKPVR